MCGGEEPRRVRGNQPEMLTCPSDLLPFQCSSFCPAPLSFSFILLHSPSCPPTSPLGLQEPRCPWDGCRRCWLCFLQGSWVWSWEAPEGPSHSFPLLRHGPWTSSPDPGLCQGRLHPCLACFLLLEPPWPCLQPHLLFPLQILASIRASPAGPSLSTWVGTPRPFPFIARLCPYRDSLCFLSSMEADGGSQDL